MPGHKPPFVSTSLWHTPQACTLIRACPASGVGISRSTISKSAPGLEICATFIFVIFIGTTLLVAINPPANLCRCSKHLLSGLSDKHHDDHATFATGVVSTFVTTLMLPCVALEYGHSWCAASTNAWATSSSIPGRLTVRRA